MLATPRISASFTPLVGHVQARPEMHGRQPGELWNATRSNSCSAVSCDNFSTATSAYASNQLPQGSSTRVFAAVGPAAESKVATARWGGKAWPLTGQIPTRTITRPDRTPWEKSFPRTPLHSMPRVRTEFARRAFSVAGPTVYNSLPADIKLCHSMHML